MTENNDFERQHEQDCVRTTEVRSGVWNRWGTLDEYVIAPIINPGFMGGDFWPNTRQAHVASRRDGAVLLASDGLADPFDDPDQPRVNGYGIEFYAITTDKELVEYQTITDLGATWLFTLVGGMSGIEASGTHLVPILERYENLSVELSGSMIPDEFADTFLTDGDGVGALVNLTDEATIPAVVDGPLSPIRLVNVKLLTRAETDFIVTGNPQDDVRARAELSRRLTAQGDPLVSSLDRASVV